jgi:hypothetical protein
MTYRPSVPVVAVRSADVGTLLSVTFAPGTAAPDGSRTTPEIDPASAWANARFAQRNKCTAMTTTKATMFFAVDLMGISLLFLFLPFGESVVGWKPEIFLEAPVADGEETRKQEVSGLHLAPLRPVIGAKFSFGRLVCVTT